jgi:hypothetical protein
MATYFWVGGTGTWNGANAANWSASSGGAGGAGVPNGTDTVNFNSLSGTGTCTTASGSACAIAILNSSTCGLTLGANHTMSGAFTYTLGTISLASYTLTCSTFVSANANVRTLAFGTGNITVTGNNGVVYATANRTNLTITGTPVVNATYSGSVGTRTINLDNGGGTFATRISLNVLAGTDIVTTSGNNNGSLDFTGFAGTWALGSFASSYYGDIKLNSSMTVDAGTNTTQNFIGTSGIQKITLAGKQFNNPIIQNGAGGTVQLQDTFTTGSTRTYTLTAGDLHINNQTLSTGLFASANSNIRIIDFKSGNITTTGSGTVWNTGVLTNFSYLGTPTVNISNNSATATTVITGTVTESLALNFNYTTGTYTLTDTAAVYKNLNFTGFSGTIPNSTRTIYGGATFSAGMTLTAGANVTTFAATSGTNNITTAAKTLDFPITFNGIGGTWAFQDALTQGSTRAFTITNGTVRLKSSATSTTGAFATSGTNQKFLQSTTPGTQATLTQASGTVDASYLTIKDINATGGATWLAYTNQSNTDAGNVDGWDFGISPVVGGAEYTYTLRSFTQPRRF